MRIMNCSEMKEMEKVTIEEYGFNESLIIENVGVRGADYLYENFLESDEYYAVLLLLGKGNNGADGLSIGRHLSRYGVRVRAFLTEKPENCSKELQAQLKMAQAYGVRVTELSNSEQLMAYFTEIQYKYFVIDALYGTGVYLPLGDFQTDVINLANKFAEVMVSIDIPSGVTGDTGETQGAAIKADLTLSIGIPKIGHFVSQGPKHSGEICIIDGGFPTEQLSGGDKFLLELEDAKEFMPLRNPYGHKNTYGHVLAIGGSAGKSGAIFLSAEAALRSGAGMVTIATWDESYNEVTALRSPEIMQTKLPGQIEQLKNFIEGLKSYQALIIGPGLGVGNLSRELVLGIITSFQGPVIMDADALNVLDLDKDQEILKTTPSTLVFTPHPGELSRLLSNDKKHLKNNPLDALRSVSEKTNACVLLKDATSYIKLPDGKLYISHSPNDALATAGSGDVLAGLLGGVAAQNFAQMENYFHLEDRIHQIELSVCFGLLLQSIAGHLAAEHLSTQSVSATDLIDYLSEAYKFIQQYPGN